MKICNCKKEEFVNIVKDKKIICFGASKMLPLYYEKNEKWFALWENQIIGFIDNDSRKWGQQYCFGNSEYPIYQPKCLETKDDYILLITTGGKMALEIINDIEVRFANLSNQAFILPLILYTKECDDSAVWEYVEKERTLLNQKIIHTFWFSGEPIPESYQRCINSWKKYCPDYEIKIWNAETYDVNKNMFMKQAFEAKKWAFVSDYARLDVIYEHGGIYMDMDVEVLRPLDRLLQLESFFGIDTGEVIDLGTCFGALRGNNFVKQLRDSYENEVFILEDGSYNTVPQPAKLIGEFEKYGFERKQVSQIVNNTFFLSMNYLEVYGGKRIPSNRKSGKEFLIHWHNAGWKEAEYFENRYIGSYMLMEELEEKCKT